MNKQIRRSNREVAIAFYSYGRDAFAEDFVLKYLELVQKFFPKLGLGLSYWSVCRNDRCTGYKKVTPRTWSLFKPHNIEILSITSNPEGTDEPNFDKYAICPTSYSDVLKCTRISFVVNKTFLQLHTEIFHQIFQEMLLLYPWDFGMAFEDKVLSCEFQIYEGIYRKLPIPTQKNICKWYDVDVEDRLVKLRTIFPYNMLNINQLSREISKGVTLKDYIENSDTSLSKMLTHEANKELYLWTVPEDKVEKIHNDLIDKDIIVY